MSDALLVGRKPTKLIGKQPPVLSEALFEADRVDGQTFEAIRFEHCTFANVSFKQATLVSCTFENCVFMECYFRLATLDSSRFLGSKFINCDFPKASFRQCSFIHAHFRGCFIPYQEFEQSLPTQANLRRLLAENLSREAEAAGASADARQYRLQGYRSYERYLWNGLLGADAWSREHFPSLGERVVAGLRLLGRWANRMLWGYGEQGLVLIRNATIVVFGVFPLLYYLWGDDLEQVGGDLGAASYFLLSVDALLNGSGFSGVSPTTSSTRVLVLVEVLVGLIFIGLAVTLLFRWITRRR
jgi:hypothetical protein